MAWPAVTSRPLTMPISGPWSSSASTWSRRGGALLGRGRHPGKLVGVTQLEPGDVDDLLGMAIEMGQGIKRRGQHGFIETLNASRLLQLSISDGGEHSVCLAHHRVQAPEQLVLGDGAAFGKLAGP